MGFCVFVHGIFFFFFFFFFFLKLIIYMSGVVASLSWGVVTTRTCTSIFKSKSANRTVPLASLVLRIPVEAVLGNFFRKFLTISSYGIHN